MWTKIVSDEYPYDRIVGWWYTKRFFGNHYHVSISFLTYKPWFTFRIVNRKLIPNFKVPGCVPRRKKSPS